MDDLGSKWTSTGIQLNGFQNGRPFNQKVQGKNWTGWEWTVQYTLNKTSTFSSLTVYFDTWWYSLALKTVQFHANVQFELHHQAKSGLRISLSFPKFSHVKFSEILDRFKTTKNGNFRIFRNKNWACLTTLEPSKLCHTTLQEYNHQSPWFSSLHLFFLCGHLFRLWLWL